MSDSLFAALNEILNKDLLIPLENGSQLIIREGKNDAKDSTKCSSVVLKKSGKTFSFTLDQDVVQPFPFFNDVKGVKIKKKNDATIFCTHKGKVYILLIELKSTKVKREDVILKLRSGKRFVDYLLSMIFLCYGISLEVEYRCVLYKKTKVKTPRPTRKGGTPVFKDVHELKVTEEDCDRQLPLSYFLQG